MQSKIGMRYFISGKVQGVWFRASTQEQAKALEITGWARNLPDGRVEVLAFGEKENLQKLHAWLRKGPPLANVEEVIAEMAEWEEYERFGVG